MVDRLGEQFARHEAFLETGGTQACEQVEIVEVGDLATEGVQVACKGHPASPGTSDGEVLQEREAVQTHALDWTRCHPARVFWARPVACRRQ